MQIRSPYRPVVGLALLAGVLVTLLVQATAGAGTPGPQPITATDTARASSTGSDPLSSALAVLHAWDGRRAAVYAAGDVDALRALYVPGATAGRADSAMLRDYLRRGLRVRWLTTQVLSARVLARHRDRLRLGVVDRVAGGAAVGRRRCFRLPRDRPVRRVIELRRVGGHWLVARVVA